MAKLILSMDGLVLKEIPLTKERMTIGRKPHNDIQIDNLAISGEHAALVTILNDSFLEDLNSTNGTLVNGQPIKKHFLQNGDVVELGKYKLKFISDLPAAREGETDFEKTMVLRPGSIQPQEAPAASAVGEATHANFGDVRIPSPPPAAPAAAAAPLLGGGADSQRRQCGQGAGTGEDPHHPGQARRAGGRHHPAAPWLFHHPRGRRPVPGGQRQDPGTPRPIPWRTTMWSRSPG